MSINGAIRRSSEYYEGYSKGYNDGFNKAFELLQEKLNITHATEPIIIKCIPNNSNCPILKAKGVVVGE